MADLKISYEFNQSGKKQPVISYVINFSYGSKTLTLFRLCIPFAKNKQNNFKLNVNTTWTIKNIASWPDWWGEGGGWGALNFLKKFFILKSEINSEMMIIQKKFFGQFCKYRSVRYIFLCKYCYTTVACHLMNDFLFTSIWVVVQSM